MVSWCSLCCLIPVVGSKFILKNYIGLTSWKKSPAKFKRIKTTLTRDCNRYYNRNREEEEEKGRSMTPSESDQEADSILLSREFHDDIILNNIKVKVKRGVFR